MKENSPIRKIKQWNALRLNRRRLETRGGSKPHKLAVLGIMKNESLNIEEWIHHYHWQRADRIFVIDNGSSDDSAEKVLDLSNRLPVSLMSLPEQHRQVLHYWKATQEFRILDSYQWLLVADIDEFWFCKRDISIREALVDYSHFDVLYCNWSEFGASGKVEHPDSLRRELLLRHPEIGNHRHTKWICNTDVLKNSSTIGVHKIYGARSERVISVNDDFQINHYRTQSRFFWETVKLTRGMVSRAEFEGRRLREHFDEHEAKCISIDTLLADRLAKKEGRDASGN